MIPKYKKIITYIEGLILEGKFKKGDKLPSINLLKKRFSLSRDTVLLGLYDLKARGIIISVPGKGYYVHSEDISCDKRVFLLFDELNSFKEDLFNSFISSLNDDTKVDLFFHHFNFNQFSQLIYQSIGNYNSYVIMPANLTGLKHVIEKLPFEKTFILDQMPEELQSYSGIFQNFEEDMYSALKELKDLIIPKYEKINFIFTEKKLPRGLLNGFDRFCDDYNIPNEKHASIKNIPIKKGDVFLLLEDRELITLIKRLKNQGLKLGVDVGAISYNESALKEIVYNGITTISTDFMEMGEKLANLITENKQIQIENKNNVILRNSL